MMKIVYILFLSIAFITILSSAITSVSAINEPVKAIDNQSKVMYSVKFVCVPLVGPDKEGAFVPQNYSTVINVHNPYSHSIFFLKKAVIAQSEDEERGQISKFMKDALKPDQALSINCKDIVNLFNNTSSSIGDGFVVLLSNEKLDVSSVYTTQSSIDVEYIQPTTSRASDKLPDLTIKILTLQGNCPTGQGSCIHTVEMKVTNLSTEAVNTPFNIKTNSDNGLSTIQTIPSIPGSTSQTVTAVLGPGNNCWNPDCQIDTFVDSSNIVIESDETNNKDSYFSLG
jgi:CARDB protein